MKICIKVRVFNFSPFLAFGIQQCPLPVVCVDALDVRDVRPSTIKLVYTLEGTVLI